MKLLASDGLLARPAGIWTREKLTYLEKYANAFMKSMAPKRAEGKWERLVYIDLLAGPGRDRDNDTDAEFNGSPLIALGIRPKFDHLYLADKSKDNVAALRKRIPPSETNRVTLQCGDCNILIDQVLGKLE